MVEELTPLAQAGISECGMEISILFFLEDPIQSKPTSLIREDPCVGQLHSTKLQSEYEMD